MNTHIQLVLFLFLAIIFNVITLKALAIVLAAILPWLFCKKNTHFLLLLKRLKWFFVVMLLIYMFNTPGEYMMDWPFAYRPTYEGIQLAGEQILRIVLIVVMLSIINQQNSKRELMAGLYALIQPLRLIGVDINRFTVRLWLTLNYVDHPGARHQITSVSSFFDAMHQAISDETVDHHVIMIESPRYQSGDYLMVILVVMLFGFVILQV